MPLVGAPSRTAVLAHLRHGHAPSPSSLAERRTTVHIGPAFDNDLRALPFTSLKRWTFSFERAVASHTTRPRSAASVAVRTGAPLALGVEQQRRSTHDAAVLTHIRGSSTLTLTTVSSSGISAALRFGTESAVALGLFAVGDL